MESLREKGEVNKVAYLKWYIDHEPTCYLNHDGSSAAMEASGVLQLYERSLEKRKLRYIPFVGDGDSKSYVNVCKAQPYGPAVFIPKEECIGHVTKRMGTALRSLVTEWKGKKLKDGKGLTGMGRLTTNRIDTLQNFYGRVIRDNQGDAEAMAKGTRAILKHYSSTPEVPQHDDCPAGADSWCSYQRDKATNTTHHKPIKNPFSPEIVELVQPIFARLGSKEFLAGCEKGLTQNANECLHHVIWGMAPKGCLNSPQEISTAIHLGVLIFNGGLENTMSNLLGKSKIGIELQMRTRLRKMDNERIYISNYQASDTTKKRRKKKRKQKLKKMDAFAHVEGTTYKSQAFHGGSGSNVTKKNKKKGSKEASGEQAKAKKLKGNEVMNPSI